MMKIKDWAHRSANTRWGIIALLLGLPLPLVIVAFLFCGGCPGSR